MFQELVRVWSFGVVLYKLVCGEHPFKADTKDEYMEKSKSVSYKIPSSVNPIVADLISNCIKSRLESRFTNTEILKHRFFNPEPYVEPLRCPFIHLSNRLRLPSVKRPTSSLISSM